MFRRRRGRHRSDTAEGPDGALLDEGDEGQAVPSDRPDGPWDVGEPAPDMERVDLGAVRVPVGRDLEVQVNLADDQIVAATVVHAGSALQVQVLAAPKTSNIWDEVRRDVVRELQGTGGNTREVDGPFGTELRARVPVEEQNGKSVPRPARFVGVDGPRWLLRGVFTGPAAEDPDAARRLEDVFRAIVVVRGEAPVPPRELLELQLPPQMRGSTGGQNFDESSDEPQLDPFRRGPEITEIR